MGSTSTRPRGRGLPYASALLADACWRAGDVAEGLRIVRELEEARATNEVRFFQSPLERIGARLRSDAGQETG
jgi:hypothetical protein